MSFTSVPMTSFYGPIITQLLEKNRSVFRFCRDGIEGANRLTAVREWRTIHVGGCRQTGLSAWINQNAHEHMLVVTYNGMFEKNLRENAAVHAPHHSYRLKPFQCHTSQDVLKKRWKVPEGYPPFRQVVVDSASYVFEKVDQRTLYRWALEHCIAYPEFILLG